MRRLVPYELLEVLITVKVEGAAGRDHQPGESERRRSAESRTAETERLSTAAHGEDEATPFGIEKVQLAPENDDGSPDTQAGDHPFQLTTTLNLNQVITPNPVTNIAASPRRELLKDLQFELPPGMIGNPNAIAQCTDVNFTAIESAANACGPTTRSSVWRRVTINEPTNIKGFVTRAVPVFNLVPAPGEPARFGFFVLHDIVVLDTAIKTGEDYGVVVSVRNASQVAQVLSSQVTLWGVPGDPRHDDSRGWACVERGDLAHDQHQRTMCARPNRATKSRSCRSPPRAKGRCRPRSFADSWLNRAHVSPTAGSTPATPGGRALTSSSPGQEGCSLLPFSPSILLEPNTQSGSTPTGLHVDVHVPQDSTLADASEKSCATDHLRVRRGRRETDDRDAAPGGCSSTPRPRTAWQVARSHRSASRNAIR